MALAAVALLPAGALGAGGKPVATGNYEALAQIDKDTFAVGVFAVAKENGKRQIVPTEGYSGIYYPDAGKCDPYDAPLSVASVPISKSGRFKVKDEYESPARARSRSTGRAAGPRRRRPRARSRSASTAAPETQSGRPSRIG